MRQATITGLMLVRPGQEEGARVAAADFAAQGYPPKELVVVAEDPGGFAAPALDGPAVRVVGCPGDATDAQRRNLGLDAATGSIVCLWHPTDRNHPDRLDRQFDSLLVVGAIGSCLTDRLAFTPHDPTRRGSCGAVHWLDWRYGPTSGTGRMVADTLMYWRRPLRWEAGGPAGFFQSLNRYGTIQTLPDRGWLSARVCRSIVGDDARQFRGEARQRAVTAAYMRRNRDPLERALEAYGWDGPLRVCGSDADAFWWPAPPHGRGPHSSAQGLP